MLGLLMKLPGGDKADPAALLSRFPDASLLPLRRDGLDPVAQLTRLSATEPVSRLKLPLGLRGWVITGYEESRAVLAADPGTFSNDFGHMVGKVGIAVEDDPGGLGFADPPAHTRLRRMLTPHFTARALAARETRIAEIIEDALTDLAAAGAGGAPVDLVKHFAVPIPSRTIMELLGVPAAEQAEFQRLSTDRFVFDGGVTKSLEVIGEAVDYLQGIVAKQRIHPEPGLIGTLLTEYGDDISDVELAGLADGVLTGGLETTVSMIALGSLALLQDRATFDDLVASDEQVDALVEELLRYLSVVQVGFPRFAAKDTTLAGRTILKGDVLLPSFNAANRDPRHGTDLGRMDPHRPPGAHLSFGHGIHRCVGAELARIELRMAYPALVRRFPDLQLAADPGSLRFRELSFVYGLETLPVTTG
jgi:cytochrome P450